jgi:lipopolysaccharide/colanic/teichoic acid biosynthesis glycosyltransferase
LQDASREDAEKFLHQLQGFIGKDSNFSLWTSISIFPEDGIDLDELLMNAKKKLKLNSPGEQVPDFVSRRGDVLVSTPDRVKLEEKAEWVNKLAFQSPSSRAIYEPVKRLMDITASGLAMLLLSPLFGLIMLAILLDDGRPFFFAQERVGLGGKSFKMHKFRSMIVNAPKLEPVEVVLPDGTIRYDWPDKDEDDPRITRVGRILRKTSLDELPQIWDIFIGTMSLIGPRPSSWKLEDHTLHQTARLTVKPGLTGLWQVCDRHNKNFDERLLWDLKYVEKMGLWLDVQILFRTVAAVLKRSGV